MGRKKNEIEERKVLFFTAASYSCDSGLENYQSLGDLTVKKKKKKNSKSCYTYLKHCCMSNMLGNY